MSFSMSILGAYSNEETVNEVNEVNEEDDSGLDK